jgi:hypothetical protein
LGKTLHFLRAEDKIPDVYAYSVREVTVEARTGYEAKKKAERVLDNLGEEGKWIMFECMLASKIFGGDEVQQESSDDSFEILEPAGFDSSLPELVYIPKEEGGD